MNRLVLFIPVTVGQVTEDGCSDWLRGIRLLAVYLILSLIYFYAPAGKGT